MSSDVVEYGALRDDPLALLEEGRGRMTLGTGRFSSCVETPCTLVLPPEDCLLVLAIAIYGVYSKLQMYGNSPVYD
jgi:hypothetical protein